jgi:hypothetical protein
MAYVCLGALNLRKISTGYLPNTGTVKPTHPNKLGRWASWVNHPMLGMIIFSRHKASRFLNSNGSRQQNVGKSALRGHQWTR